MLTLRTVDDPKFGEFRRQLTQYPRMHGYYLVDIVSIESMRKAGRSQEEILDAAFEHFDDRTWSAPEARLSDVSWEAHAVDAEVAEKVVMRALIGGGEVGHTIDTIPPDVANSLWAQFRNFFADERRYYVGMGLGDHSYAYLHGAAIVDECNAGVLWVVDGD